MNSRPRRSAHGQYSLYGAVQVKRKLPDHKDGGEPSPEAAAIEEGKGSRASHKQGDTEQGASEAQERKG